MPPLPRHCWMLVATARSLAQDGYAEAAKQLLRPLDTCRAERSCSRITGCREEASKVGS